MMDERCHQGLKLVLLLEGALCCEIPVLGMQSMSGPCLCAIMDQGDHIAAQRFDPDSRLCYISVTFDSDALDKLTGANLEQLARRAGGIASPSSPLLFQRKPNPALHRLGLQMLTLNANAQPGGQLYVTGKALELAGLAIDQLCGDPVRADIANLAPADIERLYSARDILLARLDDAPDLATLARQIGLNVRKLTHGFRHLFGATPTAWMQAHRLDTAHRMIADGEWTVSQAAWKIGYTPAAFSTAFRRRFGISPGTLRH